MSTEDDREKRREESPNGTGLARKACGSTASRRWRKSASRSRRRSSAGDSRSRRNSARLVRTEVESGNALHHQMPVMIETVLTMQSGRAQGKLPMKSRSNVGSRRNAHATSCPCSSCAP